MQHDRHRGVGMGATIGLIVLAALQSARAADTPAPIAWHSDVAAAWKTTQAEGRPLLVFVTAEQCAFCVKMKQGTYANPNVAAAVNRSFVPLVLKRGTDSPLLKDLAVTAYPATFVISSDAVVLDRVNGYVSPDVLIKRLAAVQPTAQATWRAGSSKREY